VIKTRMIEPFTKGAADAYSRILTRYPLMNRADDAKARLEALHQPIPKPTKEAIAQNKAEEDSRRPESELSKLLREFEKRPDVATSAHSGEPTLVDPKPLSASDVLQQATRSAFTPSAGSSDKHSVSIEPIGTGMPPADQPAPRSDTTPEPAPAANAAAPNSPADSNELKPNVGPPDANELKPNVAADSGPAQALPPPPQLNEIQTPTPSGQSSASPPNAQKTETVSSGNQQSDTAAPEASSKHKKKKGIHKIVPF